MTRELGGWDAYTTAVVRIESPGGAIWLRPAPITRTDGQYPDPDGRPIYVITAHNPAGLPASDQANAAAQARLESELRRRGLAWWPACWRGSFVDARRGERRATRHPGGGCRRPRRRIQAGRDLRLHPGRPPHCQLHRQPPGDHRLVDSTAHPALTARIRWPRDLAGAGPLPWSGPGEARRPGRRRRAPCPRSGRTGGRRRSRPRGRSPGRTVPGRRRNGACSAARAGPRRCRAAPSISADPIA